MNINFKNQKWYFINSSIKKRRYAFLNPYIREICARSFFQTALENNYLLAAFVLMPEHIHLLSGATDFNISKEKMSKNYKGAASRRILSSITDLKYDLQSRHFWTDGCSKEGVDNIYSFKKIIEYIILNPEKDNIPSKNYFLYLNTRFLGPEFIQGLKINNKKIIY